MACSFRRERLRGLGLGEAALARIHGPEGLPIGALSPGEIAASLMAEVAAALRAGRAATEVRRRAA